MRPARHLYCGHLWYHADVVKGVAASLVNVKVCFKISHVAVGCLISDAFWHMRSSFHISTSPTRSSVSTIAIQSLRLSCTIVHLNMCQVCRFHFLLFMWWFLSFYLANCSSEMNLQWSPVKTGSQLPSLFSSDTHTHTHTHTHSLSVKSWENLTWTPWLPRVKWLHLTDEVDKSVRF